ncbi:selenium-dependent molybdenum cofactor biosynthesis protein YqeB [Loigolactobacillus coryniformis]|uniref:Molybdenum hydroxylase n=1 Tax=Loigolactobacillus coryniformis subsp. torquens DSM 20004 = KCTC 3535 TaxID=1423822 RepID=A0A2D1KM24_9LACO|nr:selenium-dependent molybdenum cofactor biosynthesis protein YqeB [Loigolactobacillus coryniformis]ATO43183.1 molybdenum hydroxylase [Loigolactobacillus coryniformis subsp. torquens DSM 20004 = KCTC 3535]MDT3392595.1 EF2563 family selenium-dependent molybdenum hydroxylase system protein [Bacillota bacterium]
MAQRTIAETIVAVRGGGDVATGTIQKLVHVGFKVVILETAQPLMIRRTVALGSAVVAKKATVEGITAVLTTAKNLEKVWANDQVPVIIDPEGVSLYKIKPQVLIDAILAKKNLGTNRTMAPITIALGPGFEAPTDVSAAVETMRGHNLGRLIFKGTPLADTGIPGVIAGRSFERVIHAPVSGVVHYVHQIGDQVNQGETLFYIGATPIPSPLSGTLRGLIAEGTTVEVGLKVSDVDPRPNVDCHCISDKARAIGGGVLEAVLMLGHQQRLF